MYKRRLSINDFDEEENMFCNEIKRAKYGNTWWKKKTFLKN